MNLSPELPHDLVQAEVLGKPDFGLRGEVALACIMDILEWLGSSKKALS